MWASFIFVFEQSLKFKYKFFPVEWQFFSASKAEEGVPFPDRKREGHATGLLAAGLSLERRKARTAIEP